jgi:hypothetical protein
MELIERFGIQFFVQFCADPWPQALSRERLSHEIRDLDAHPRYRSRLVGAGRVGANA